MHEQLNEFGKTTAKQFRAKPFKSKDRKVKDRNMGLGIAKKCSL